MTNQIFSSLRIIALAVVLSFGLSYVYAWTAPSVAPTGGNVLAPLNTSGTAQTKAGNFTAPNLIDTSTTEQTKAGDLNLYGDATKGGNLRIKTPIYDTNTMIIGSRDIFSTGGNPLYLNFRDDTSDVSIGGQGEGKVLSLFGTNSYLNVPEGKVYAKDYYIADTGKWASTLGGSGGIDYGNCVTITHSESAKGANCGGVIVQENSADCTVYPNYVMVSNSTGLRYPGQCVAAVAKCCKLK